MQNETAKHRILVVDCDAPYSRLLVELLESRGYDATAIPGGEKALAAALAVRPDLALVDVRLPANSGLILGAALRSEFGVPFIVLAGVDDAETARRASEAGALAYLVKSGQMQHYVPTIRAALACTDELRQLQRREAQLNEALQQARSISTAIGVLMERLCLSRDQAFERLRGLARAQRRRLSDIAEQFLASVECLNGVSADVSPTSDGAVNS
jgi:response regulator NasT